ncbi:hypothetical protein D3C73_1368850 [compost metagenome]
MADLTHAPLLRVVARQMLDAVKRLVIATVLVAGKVAQPVKVRVDQLGLQQLHARKPRETLRRQRLRVAEPGVAAKHFIGCLAGNGHC